MAAQYQLERVKQHARMRKPGFEYNTLTEQNWTHTIQSGSNCHYLSVNFCVQNGSFRTLDREYVADILPMDTVARPLTYPIYCMDGTLQVIQLSVK
jgi:hypothetical protein